MRQIVMNGLTNSAKYANVSAAAPIRIAVYIGRGGGGGGGGDAAVVLAPSAASPPHPFVANSGRSVHVEPRPAPPAWLCFDVLDQGTGLRGITERVLFKDFAAPVGTSALHQHGRVSGSSAGTNNSKVGSSGLGLPICARCARPRSSSSSRK